jgi:hypothetical protein
MELVTAGENFGDGMAVQLSFRPPIDWQREGHAGNMLQNYNKSHNFRLPFPGLPRDYPSVQPKVSPP